MLNANDNMERVSVMMIDEFTVAWRSAVSRANTN